jgi:organic hydroperoxide reductase OsmC/OhrA
MKHAYTAEVRWHRRGEDFLDNRYSRKHSLRFDGGLEVPGSASPQVVPFPMSDASAMDPEEAFVASLSSCHMLFFLSLAAKARFCVDSYVDCAVGLMDKAADGKVAMTVVTLRPGVRFSGERLPTQSELGSLHHAAHESCFIANSVKTDVRCEPVEIDSAPLAVVGR